MSKVCQVCVPGSTLQRDGLPSRNDALRDLGNASRSRVSRQLFHAPAGRTVHRTVARCTFSAADATLATASTGTCWARSAGTPTVGNLRFPRQPFASLPVAHQMHACGPTSNGQNGRKPRHCYAPSWGTSGVMFSPNATAFIGAGPFSAGAQQTVRALRRYRARRVG